MASSPVASVACCLNTRSDWCVIRGTSVGINPVRTSVHFVLIDSNMRVNSRDMYRVNILRRRHRSAKLLLLFFNKSISIDKFFNKSIIDFWSILYFYSRK
uniref:Uncharacterized protein n=1 Tax=Cacopsylla melanoneura TaxID=428564 RepID=A0A8D8Q6G3_9HEMI